MSSKLENNNRNRPRLEYQVEGDRPKTGYTWFRGQHCNFGPDLAAMLEFDAVSENVIAGWTPSQPHIGRQTKTVAFGSCFAEHISDWLHKRNFAVLSAKDGGSAQSYVVRFGEGMVNTFVIRQQFEWAFENKAPEEDLWHDYDAKQFGFDEEVRRQTLDMFMDTDVFIITLGLSEIWYDEVTGGVFWRAVPRRKYDPSRHKFRISTTAENRDNIVAITDLIGKYRPDAKIIFTVSPIPLVATFRPISCITANSVSKAVIRSALDEALREIDDPDRVHYWPSYEIIMDAFSNQMRGDNRHIKQPILDYVMTLFETVWCNGSVLEMSLWEAWLRARAADRTLPLKYRPNLLYRQLAGLVSSRRRAAG